MLKLATTIFLLLLMLFVQSALAETDVEALLQDGTASVSDYDIAFIDAEPGQTVHKEWHVEHKYFEKVLNWDFNDYCDAFRAHNPQFAHLFNDVSGEANPGFRKLPAGQRWNMPVAFSATSLQQLDLQENEDFTAEVVGDSVIIVKMPKGIAQARTIARSYAMDKKAFLSKVDYVLKQDNAGFSVVKDSNIEFFVNETFNGISEKVETQPASNEIEKLSPSKMSADNLTEHFKGTMFEYAIKPAVILAGLALMFFGFLIGRVFKQPKEDKTDEIIAKHELKKCRKELEEVKEDLDLERTSTSIDVRSVLKEHEVEIAYLTQNLTDTGEQLEVRCLEISNLERELHESEEKRKKLQNAVNVLVNVTARQNKNTIPVKLPPEIFRTDYKEQVVDLQVSEWEGEPGKSDASVYVQDTGDMLRVEYDEDMEKFNTDPFIRLIQSKDRPTKKIRKHYGNINMVANIRPSPQANSV